MFARETRIPTVSADNLDKFLDQSSKTKGSEVVKKRIFELYQQIQSLDSVEYNPFILFQQSATSLRYELYHPTEAHLEIAFSFGIGNEADHYILSDSSNRCIIIRADNGSWANFAAENFNGSQRVSNILNYLEEIDSMLRSAEATAKVTTLPIRRELSQYSGSRTSAPSTERLSLQEIDGLSLSHYKALRKFFLGIVEENDNNKLADIARIIIDNREALYAFLDLKREFRKKPARMSYGLIRALMRNIQVKLSNEDVKEILNASAAQLLKVYVHRQIFLQVKDPGREIDMWLQAQLPKIR